MTEARLNELRKEVDILDKELIDWFKRRFVIVIEIWKIKKPLGMNIKNKTREKEIIDRVIKDSGFDKKFVTKLYNLIFTETRKIQKRGVI